MRGLGQVAWLCDVADPDVGLVTTTGTAHLELLGSRENIVALDDPELGAPLRMQNVVGKLSRTPGAIRHTGPRLGEHNREVLVDLLGFAEAELAAQGIDLGAARATTNR